MSKKKNTLTDLEEFLKLQASSLVTPPSFTEKIKKEDVNTITSVAAPMVNKAAVSSNVSPSEEDLMKAMNELSVTDKKAFYSLIISITKNLSNYSVEDALLINTALYLKGGANWKEAVKEFWKKN